MNETDRFGKWYEGECFLVPPESRIVWQARAKIARQDEKELLEALIAVQQKSDLSETEKQHVDIVIGKTWGRLAE